jgi:release factor glutamine methyltransferase
VNDAPATRSLLDALRRETLWEGARVLDLGSGSGAVAIAAARRGASATAVDPSRRALLAARLGALRHGVRIRTVRGSGLEAVGRERFDCIATRDAVDAGAHLRPNGILLTPFSGKSGMSDFQPLRRRALAP